MQVQAFHIEEAAAARPGVQAASRKLTWIRAGCLLGVVLITLAALRDRSPRAEGENFEKQSNLRGSEGRITAAFHSNGSNRTASGSHSSTTNGSSENSNADGTTNGTRMNGSRANGTRTNSTWTNGTRMNGTKANRTRTNGTRTNSRWANGTRTNGTMTNGTMTNGTSTNGTRANGTRRPSLTLDLKGGWSEIPGSELGPGGHIASLAAYALDAIKGQSNSLEVQNITFGHILQASRQVVNGINSRIVIRVLPHGTITLDIFEQAWTNTLKVSAASYMPSDVALVQVDLITREHALDASGFWGNTRNGLVGGWSQVSGSELVPGRHIASLAAYALDAIKAQSNSPEVHDIRFGHVLRASRQVVNGINDRIVIQLLPHGTATLDLFEQSWTNTLRVSAASYSPSDISHVQAKLIEKALTLDADALRGDQSLNTTGSASLTA